MVFLSHVLQLSNVMIDSELAGFGNPDLLFVRKTGVCLMGVWVGISTACFELFNFFHFSLPKTSIR
jgi:hypothetical protein